MSATDTLPAGYAHRWAVMAVVIVADVLDLIDSTVANIAGPSIKADLGGGDTTLQWILAGYTLAFAVGLLTSARVGDILGRRPMFIAGMVGFTLFSLACGLAPDATVLIVFRILQGLFGAVMIPQGMAMVMQSFKEEELQKAFIPFGPVMGLAAVVGPILGGFLIDANLFGSHWRSIFLINVPIGIVGVMVSLRSLPHLPTLPGARLDPLGSLLVTLASASLVYPLVQGRDLGWPAWTYVMIAASLVVFVLFGWSERRSDHPVIEASLFGNRSFLAGIGFLGTFFVGMTGMSLVINLYLQLGLGKSPAHTGLTMVPFALGMSVGAALSGALLGPRLGRHVLHVGLAVAAVALTWFALTVGAVDHPSGWRLAPPLALAGLGLGLIFAPLFDIILAGLGDSEMGSGSGLLNAIQQFSGALGVAVLGTIFFHWVPLQGWAHATRSLMWVTIGCLGAAFLVGFLLPVKGREQSAAH